MVQGREDVDCERSRTNEARVVAGGIGEWHGVAGCEDRDYDDCGCSGGGERRRDDEQDDDELDDTSSWVE